MRKAKADSALKNFSLDRVHGKEEEVEGPLKIKVADILHLVDIQKKNKHPDKILTKYGLGKYSVNRIKTALKMGKWKVRERAKPSSKRHLEQSPWRPVLMLGRKNKELNK
jgi:hypothetical protein